MIASWIIELSGTFRLYIVTYDGTGDRVEYPCGVPLTVFQDYGFARIAALDDFNVDGNFSQERYIHFFREGFSAAAVEQVDVLTAVGTFESAHVLDYSRNR